MTGIGLGQVDVRVPLVSVVALCFNQEKFLIDTLDSIRHQNYPNMQIIILDDASSDGSPAKIKAWLRQYDGPVKVVFHSQNQGICRSSQEALQYVHGKYFQLIACDDIMLPNKIAQQVEILESRETETALVYSDAALITENGRPHPDKSFMERTLSESIQPASVYLESYKRLIMAGPPKINKLAMNPTITNFIDCR